MAVKAIETRYKGYRFRSRLEARWAVFFDALEIEWEYEPEGYDLGEGGWYLPDFWLPQVGMWAEVKGGPFTAPEREKLKALVKLTGHSGLMLDGIPSTGNYWGYELEDESAESIDDAVGLCDWVFQTLHRYWETESRFYCCTGAWPEERLTLCGHDPGCLCEDCDPFGAVAAARSARFEHGEHGGEAA